MPVSVDFYDAYVQGGYGAIGLSLFYQGRIVVTESIADERGNIPSDSLFSKQRLLPTIYLGRYSKQSA